MSKWHVNGIKVGLDLSDLATVKRYEKACMLMQMEENQLKKEKESLAPSVLIERFCDMYQHFFENLLGKKKAKKIFKGIPVNVEVYTAIFTDFLEYVKSSRTSRKNKRFLSNQSNSHKGEV